MPQNHNDHYRAFIENHDIVGRKPGEAFCVVKGHDFPEGLTQLRVEVQVSETLAAKRDARALGHVTSGPWHDGKGSPFEGGHRVPLIARWPGQMPSATVSDETICLPVDGDPECPEWECVADESPSLSVEGLLEGSHGWRCIA